MALINDLKKEYMIMNTDHLENGYEDENFKFLQREDFVKQIEQLKSDGYNILSCAEDYYYEELEDL